METYITVSFWLGVFAISVNMIKILVCEYPKREIETLGQQVFKILIGTGFAVWAGFILYAG